MSYLFHIAVNRERVSLFKILTGKPRKRCSVSCFFSSLEKGSFLGRAGIRSAGQSVVFPTREGQNGKSGRGNCFLLPNTKQNAEFFQGKCAPTEFENICYTLKKQHHKNNHCRSLQPRITFTALVLENSLTVRLDMRKFPTLLAVVLSGRITT